MRTRDSRRPLQKKRTAMVNRHCRFSFIGLKPKRRNRTDEVEFRRKQISGFSL